MSVASLASRLRVCVVGAGPAGLYAADRLIARAPACARVDVMEAMPAPFGLVRYGVAPDHQDTKNVQNRFNAVLGHDRVRLLGNVALGADVSLEELQERYDAVVVATGTPNARALGVPGEHLRGVVSARDFVGWYNGHPSYVSAVDPSLLSESKHVVVFGLGNVALDMARLLVKGAAHDASDILSTTDVAEHALSALVGNAARRVTFVGRRSAANIAFTAKELREFVGLDATSSVRLVDAMLDDADRDALKASRRHRRSLEVLEKAAAAKSGGGTGVEIEARFLSSPVEFEGDDSGRVRAVRLLANVMQGDSSSGRRAVEAVPRREVVIPCDLALVSVGYVRDNDGVLAGAKHDGRGRVLGKDGVYLCGWLKRGATGIIGTNLDDAEDTVSALLEDLGNADPVARRQTSDNDVVHLLSRRGVRVVDNDAWRRLEAHEERLGEVRGCPRVKVCDVASMLEAAGVA
ncbi:NADPH:adrenodoxin oxidoreductase, mitochondrial [Pseudoscourfieldia marina]